MQPICRSNGNNNIIFYFSFQVLFIFYFNFSFFMSPFLMIVQIDHFFCTKSIS